MSDHSTGRPAEPAWVRVVEHIARACGAASGVLVVLLTVLTLADITGRNFFGRPISGALEISAFWLMPGLTLLAVPLAQIGNDHVRVTLMIESAPVRTRRVLEIVAECFGCVLLAMLFFLFGTELIHTLDVGLSAPAQLWLVLWPGLLLGSCGLLAALVTTSVRFYRLTRSEIEFEPEDDRILQSLERREADVD